MSEAGGDGVPKTVLECIHKGELVAAWGAWLFKLAEEKEGVTGEIVSHKE